MDTAEARIARVLNISQVAAGVFLSQARSAAGWPPHGAWIARCLELFPELSTPEDVANKLAEMGWVSHEYMGLEPPRRRPETRPRGQPAPAQEPGAESNAPDWLFGERRASERAAAKRRAARRACTRRNKPKHKPRAEAPQAGLVEGNPSDQGRVPVGRLGRCPHGVPLTGVCAICQRAKFEQRGDPD